jgi:two-component system, cell cycle response regulator DivK
VPERGKIVADALILIIEDNPKNLKLIRDLLQFKGYRTSEAATAEAGIDLAREQRPTLILMDIQLPGMDGREAMKILKGDGATSEIPIIALTASAMKGDREALLAEGFDGYIAKPINIKEVPDVVASYVSA